MIKKRMNSLFLKYLIESENKLEQYDGWIDHMDLNDSTLSKLSSDLMEQLVLIFSCFGEIGWSLPNHSMKHIATGRILDDIKNGVSIDEIDTKIADCFCERDIEGLVVLTGRKISLSEKTKLDLAFELYLKQEYFTSAVLLAGLIDSASINHVLNNNVNSENISQCWKCYGKVIQDNFGGIYFSDKFPFSITAKDDERGKATIEFFKSLKRGNYYDEKEDILISLSFALLKFFDDSDWRDKKNGLIPSSINRHWLAHNMYDYNDIARADCVKLFCLLYQIVELYSLL